MSSPASLGVSFVPIKWGKADAGWHPRSTLPRGAQLFDQFPACPFGSRLFTQWQTDYGTDGVQSDL